jgi:hypothetical protein
MLHCSGKRRNDMNVLNKGIYIRSALYILLILEYTQTCYRYEYKLDKMLGGYDRGYLRCGRL